MTKLFRSLILFTILLNALAFADDEEELHLPNGYEIADFEDADFENVVEPPFLGNHKALIPHTEDESSSMAMLEGSSPSSTIANCVSVISGEYFDTSVDLVVPGPHPLIVQRSYNSSEKKWQFSHMPKLVTTYNPKHKQIIAGYQDGYGSGMSYNQFKNDLKKVNSCLRLDSTVFEKGLTNCGSGELSGQTNWVNSKIIYIKKDDKKLYAVQHPNRVNRVFKRYEADGKHSKGGPLGKFHISFEESLNGTRLEYKYLERFSTNNPIHIVASDALGNSLGAIGINHFEQGKMTWTGTNANVTYKISENKRFLSSSAPTNAIPVSYEYNKSNRVCRKVYPEGRYLTINYYIKTDANKRVSSLSAPVGNDEKPIVTYRFEYDLNKDIRKTRVFDALNHKTEYSYDKKTKRLSEIVYFDEHSKQRAKDCYFWAGTQGVGRGNLLARVFYDSSNPIFSRNFKYDNYGNVTKDTLSGNLTGTSAISLKVDSAGNPIINGSESYSKTSKYSSAGTNLLLKEDDGRKWVKYSYYPENNQVRLKLTGSNDTIFKREFFEYDHNGVLITELYDDGVSDDIEDLTGVTERHSKIITLTACFPVGLPETVEEQYLDLASSQNNLLKKTVNKYSPHGKILSQEVYGSDSNLAYTLQWDYDHLGNITNEVNALGEVSHYRYDANGNKIYEDKQGVVKEFVYDFANRLIREDEIWEDGTRLTTRHQYNILSQRVATTDSYGNVTRFTYDVSGHLIKTELPPIFDQNNALVTSETKTSYNAMGNAIKKWDANGFSTHTDYTIRGQPYRIEHPDGSIERNEYSLDGLLARAIAKNGLSTSYTYDAQGRVVCTEIHDSTGNLLKTTSSLYNSFHLISETDEAGLTTTYEYDSAGRRILQTKGNQNTRYEYDALGRVCKVIEHINDREARVGLKEYDILNRVIEERTEDLDGNIYQKECFKYDCRDNKIETTQFTSAGKSTTKKEYNPQNELTRVIDALGHEVNIHYDYNYPYQGQFVKKVTVIDPVGNQEIKIYDTCHRISAMMRSTAFGKLLQHETYIYDADGRRLFLNAHVYEDSHFQRTITSAWEYDSMGNTISFTEAVGTPDQKTTRIQYNNFGQKESVLTPKGIIIYHNYNALGLLSDYYSSDHKLHYSYSYDDNNHPVQVVDHIHGTVNTREYDIQGRLVSETLDTRLTTEYSYDSLNRPLLVTLSDGSAIGYRYDSANLRFVDRIKDGKIIYSHTYSDYDQAGNLLSEKLLGNAGTITYEYDLLQRAIETTAPHWSETISSDGFDAVGNLLHRQVTDHEGPIDYRYAYDELYQLTSEKGAEEHTYCNDSIYNRTAKDGQTYSLNDLNQLLQETDARYEYDSNGNLIRKTKNGQVTSYSYDPLDRLVEISDGLHTTQYIYDSFHRRIAKVQDNEVTQYLYNGQNEIGSSVNGTIKELRLLGLTRGAEIGASTAIELGDNVYAPVHDPMGNIVALVDREGKLAAAYRYTAFGEKQTLKSNLTQDNPWGYSSKRYDAESGFVNFGRRYYVPEIGRFITADPAGYVDGPNLYAYVHNHPLAYIDPDGRFFFLLAPMVVSMAIDYCLPAATAYLVEAAAGSAIGTAVAGAVIGVVKGYNGDYFDACALPGTAGYYTEIVGRAIGGACSLGSPKALIKNGSQAIAMGSKAFVSDVAKKTALEGADQARKSVTQKVAKEAANQSRKQGKQIVKTADEIGSQASNFSKNNYRKNLKKLTGQDPSSHIDAHHIFPQKHRDKFFDKGINIHDPKYCAWWEKSSHLQNASNYNNKWDIFFETNLELTQESILKYGKELMSNYKINVNY